MVDKPGAAGTVGVTQVIRAEPDGYTLGFVPTAPMTMQPHIRNLVYDTPDDYEPIVAVSHVAEAFSVRADAPWDTLKEFLQSAQDTRRTVAVSGEGTILDIDARLLAKRSGANLTTVSYEGEQQLLSAMLGGTADAAVSGVAAIQPFAEAGKAKVLAVFAEERVPSMPKVPTVKEAAGYSITFGVTHFLIAPKGTDKDIINKLVDIFRQASKTESYQQFLKENGFSYMYMSPKELEAFLWKRYKQFDKVADELNLGE